MTQAQKIQQLQRDIAFLKRNATISDNWMPVKEVMQQLGVTRKTCYKWSSQKRFRTTRVGGLKFRRQDLEELLNSKQTQQS